MSQQDQDRYDARKVRAAELIEALPHYARPFVEEYEPLIKQWCRLKGCCEQLALIQFAEDVRKMLRAQWDNHIAHCKVAGHKSESLGV